MHFDIDIEADVNANGTVDVYGPALVSNSFGRSSPQPGRCTLRKEKGF
jgi:hypothetical protein